MMIAKRHRQQIDRLGGRFLWFIAMPAVSLLGYAVYVTAQEPSRPTSARNDRVKPPDRQVPVPALTSNVKYSDLLETAKRRMDELQQQGLRDETAQLRGRIEAVMKIAETGELPASDSLELHAVGLYQGQPYNLERGEAAVRITHTGSPMILLLTSYEPIRWQLEVAKGVQLKQVILGGTGEGRVGQSVTGLPDGTSLADYSQPKGKRIGFTYSREPVDSSGDRFAQLDAQLYELTGLHIQTFEGMYSPRKETIVIGPENKSWREQRARSAAEQLVEFATRESRASLWNEIKDLRFSALYLVDESGPQRDDPFDNRKTAVFGKHSVLGPIESKTFLVPDLQQSRQVDPRGPIQLPFRIFNPDTGDWTTVDDEGSEGIPRFTHVCAQAYDTKRNRWVIIGDAGEHFMYSYDPGAKKPWSVIRPMKRIDCHALCYSPDDDTCYAAVHSHTFDGGLALYGFESDGTINMRKFLDGVQGRRGPDHRNWVNIYPVERFLVLYVQRHADPGTNRDMNYGRIFSNIIDRKSGVLLCTLPVGPPASEEEQLKALEKTRQSQEQAAKPRLAPEPELPKPKANEERAGAPRQARVPHRLVVANKATGHAYEVVLGAPVAWEKARQLASESQWQGRQGHLATITSADEATFLTLQFADTTRIWLGGRDENGEGVWRWTDGPEKDQTFWERNKSTSAFADWIRYTQERRQADEPDSRSAGSHFLAWHPGPSFPEKDAYFRQERMRGTWLDMQATDTLPGFLVEYSPPPPPRGK